MGRHPVVVAALLALLSCPLWAAPVLGGQDELDPPEFLAEIEAGVDDGKIWVDVPED